MGPGKKMELPYRRYSVPETVMRKYWMSREKANTKNMVDKSAQTEWRPCVIWTEASSSGSRGRSASEPWLQTTEAVRSIGKSRPVTAPSTPSWSSTSLPPPTTSAPTSSTSTSLPTTGPTHSPRPPPSVQVVCFHHGVSKCDVILQFPEPSESTPSEEFTCFKEVGVNTDCSPPPSPTPDDICHDVAIQTGSRPSSEEDSLSKLCQTDFTVPPTPPTTTPAQSKRVDFSCQTGKSIEFPHTKPESELQNENSESTSNSDINNTSAAPSQKKNPADAGCATGNYKDFPGTDMVIPRYSAVPRTGSMVVNMSSIDNISDSDLSLTDSLEDPDEELIAEWPENKLDNRLVRGEVLQPPAPYQRSFISSKNTHAYFLFLSGEEGSIKEYKVPDKIEARLRRREEEIKKVFGLKYKNVPKIMYRKRRRIQPLVLRETECQTNISKSMVDKPQPLNKKLVPSKSFDSSSECTASKQEHNTSIIKKFDRSKTISSFNVEAGINQISCEEPLHAGTTESSDEKTPRISLTLTVPSKTKRKDEETLDEKVAKVLIQSLEEIRCQQHSVHATINEKPSELSQHFMRKAQAMTNAIPGPSYRKNNIDNTNPILIHSKDEISYGAQKWEMLKKNLPDGRINKQPNVKYEEVLSNTIMKNSIDSNVKSEQKTSENNQTEPYLRVTKDNRQFEQTCSDSSQVTSQRRNEAATIRDEDLLRAVLKKSMQSNLASSSSAGADLQCREMHKKHEAHSQVCELGLKYLSNEICLDQFIAGIPLERIEEDVKRLMYKHYLGTKPNSKEIDSAYESIMKKKMVVSFIDKDIGSGETSENTKIKDSCDHCRGNLVESNIGTTRVASKPKDNDLTEEYSDEVHCQHCQQCYTAEPQHQFQQSYESDKVEKCVSPLDKAVATAVQTVESFLDSERPPAEISTNGQYETVVSSSKHQDHCKYNHQNQQLDCSKYCSCKNSNRDQEIGPHKNGNQQNNHSPLNKSFYSPRPVKSCIKNNFDSKSESKCESYQTPPKKISAKDEHRYRETKKEAAKIYSSKKSKNEINVANKELECHLKEPLEVKVVDNKGNILTRGVRNTSEKADKKTAKINASKKGQTQGNKFTQMFEVIPEERITSDCADEYDHKLSEMRTRNKKQGVAPLGYPKQHSSRSYMKSNGTEGPLEYYGTPKKLINKVETTSRKSVSTMVNFEKDARELCKKQMEKEKSSKNYQLKSKHNLGKDREIFIEDTKTDGRKGVVIGSYHPVHDRDIEEQAVVKKQGKSSRKQDSEDMMRLSKGWINFYLVKDNNHLTELANRDDVRSYIGEQDEESSRRTVPKSTQTLEKQVQLPSLLVKDSRKGYKSSSDDSNLSLPEIRSSSSSGPSSPENVQRNQFFRKPIDSLPELRSEAYVVKKKKHHYSNSSGDQKSDSGLSRDGERATRRVEVSRSEHSVSSVTSSTVVLSESPGHERIRSQDRKNRKSKATTVSQSNEGSRWTVTVAGSGGTGHQAPPDVEMRLSFAGKRDESPPHPVLYTTHKATNLAIKSSKIHEIVEEKPSSARSDTSVHYSSGEPVSSVTMSKRIGPSRNLHSTMYLDHHDYRQHRTRRGTVEDDWISDRRDGLLHVTGSAITPEEKPRVPTQSERDLVRSHRYRFTR